MIQQVNLYQDGLKQSQKKPVTNPYVYSLIGSIILLFCFSIYLVVELNNTKNTLKTSKQQLTAAETQIQRLQAKYPKQQINDLLRQEILRSKNILANLSQVIQLLSDKTSDQTQGFSRYFSALARQSIADVWLQKLIIDGQKNTLTLQGSTYNPEKIPLMLQKLHDESIFQGKTFAKLIMTQAQDDDNQVDFTVSTLTELSEQANHD